MKTKISLFLATVATSTILACGQAAPTLAQSPSRYYCGSNNGQEFATILVTKNERKENTFIVWKSKELCRRVSTAFQRASEKNNLKFFTAGETKEGKGVVCGVSSRGKICKQADILFEVENKNKAQKFASELESIRNGQGNSPIEP